MKIERTGRGLLELRRSGDAAEFRRLADAVRANLGGRWLERSDGLDRSYRELEVGSTTVTVHREHDLGVCVFCGDEPAGRAVLERLRCAWIASAGEVTAR